MDTRELLEELFGQLNHRLDAIEAQVQALHTRLNDEMESPKLVKLNEAWKLLGYKNYDACLYKIRSGHYRVGKEIVDRRSPKSSRPDWYADIEKCQARDRTLASKRSGLKSA
jgi:mRNA-degrading endonuclease RelE of RelBE toxin-antitoxin system